MTSIRPADDADMAAVADLWHEGWHDGHAGHVPDGLTAARTLAAFHERTPSRVADTAVAVAEDGDAAGLRDGRRRRGGAGLRRPGRRAGPGWRPTCWPRPSGGWRAGGHASAWLAVVAGNARARRFYEQQGWVDRGDLPYEVSAGGQSFVSPCRRYVKRVDT